MHSSTRPRPHSPIARWRRRLRTALVGVTALAIALPAALLPGAAASADDEGAPAYGAPDAIAADYYGALLRHTRWSETVWDTTIGAYKFADFNFAVVLGNAVLLTHGDYDEQLAGISKENLRSKTIATIKHYAALNRFVNPSGTWGKKMFWDSTFQSYFLTAGKLLWDQLDEPTRTNLTTIAVGQSTYTSDLNHGKDPLSGSWTADWPLGKHDGDTAQEEAGVYTQALAPGLAWDPNNADAGRWNAQLGDWVRNAAGQPTADKNNPAIVAGKPISSNTMQTIYDTYLVENHGSFGPHYQSDLWRSGGRNAIQFIVNNQPIPEYLTTQPNSAELWESIKMVMSNQGEPFMPMVADREFLYGRDVLPIAFLGQVLRDPDAVRAEANLAQALEDYQAYAPTDRLTKFSGEPKYEPEARAEIAISYLLHVESANSEAGVVAATPQEEFFERLSGVRDFGAEPGITVQQSDRAWAAAASKKGFVKFPWAPEHNSWLFYLSSGSQYLFPNTGAVVDTRNTEVYTTPRDGFEGTASLFTVGSTRAGQVTLPTGSALYASSGAGVGDGTLTVRNLQMGGYAGLDGSRSYTTAGGEVTEALPPKRPADPLDTSAARIDDLNFTPTSARYVRMQGVRGNPTFGYSMYSFHVYGEDQSSGTDLAAGKTATASSQDAAGNRQASKVTDSTASSRWSVSVAERTRADSWIQVDLGSEQTVGGVRLAWEASAGSRYHVQTSTNGVDWTPQTTYGRENAADANVFRLDTVDLTPAGAGAPAPVDARYVRMQGVQGEPTYGYSLYHLRALKEDGSNAAAGKPATASSFATGNAPGTVTDGSATTRWAVVNAERSRADSWIQVDLGAVTPIAKVQLGWESAAGREYKIQTSLDGETWTDSAHYRYTGDQITSTDQGWLNVEGTAGFVVHGTDSPITVSRETDAKHTVRLADTASTTTPFLVEMVPGDAAATAAEAAAPQPTVEAEGVLASTLDGYLSVFNLTGEEVTTTVSVPYTGDRVSLFEGKQDLGADSSRVTVTVPAGSAAILPPRFDVARDQAAGLAATVANGSRVSLKAPGAATVSVRALSVDQAQDVVIPEGDKATARFADAVAYPVQDLALSRLTFPASVLPTGMTSPALAVDGDAGTAWTPGPDGRMVIDLGSAHELGDVALLWDGTKVPEATVSVSDDGLTFRDVGAISTTGSIGIAEAGTTARYVAVSTDWSATDSSLTAFKVLPPGVDEPVGPGAIEGELPEWTVGEEASGSVSAGGHPTPEYTVTDGELPEGISLDADSGEFGGVPVTGGDFAFTVTAANGVGDNTSLEFTGAVTKATPVLDLVATVVDGHSGTLTATLRNGDDEILTEVPGSVEFFRSADADDESVGAKPLDEGVAVIDVTDLEAGSTTSYTAVFTPASPADQSYASATSEAAVLEMPSAGESVTSATVGTVQWGQAPVAEIQVTTPDRVATGSVTVTVDEQQPFTAPLADGKASVPLPSDLAIGTHSVFIEYTGDADTSASSTTVTFAVSKIVPALTVSAPSARYGKAATVTVQVGARVGGSVKVAVAGKSHTAPVSNGSAKVTLPTTLPAGQHTVRVTYSGDAHAASASTTATIRVAKASTKVSLSLKPTKATAKRTTVKATVTVTVPGTKVAATGKVAITVKGKTVKTVTLSKSKNGRITVSLPKFAKTGKVSVKAKFLGNSNLGAKWSSAKSVRVVR